MALKCFAVFIWFLWFTWYQSRILICCSSVAFAFFWNTDSCWSFSLSYPWNCVKCNSGSPLSHPPTLEHFAQLAVRMLQTSVYILLHYVPCIFDPSVLDSLLGFHCSCVWLWTRLWLYFSSISAFVCIEYNLNSISVYKLNVLST